MKGYRIPIPMRVGRKDEKQGAETNPITAK